MMQQTVSINTKSASAGMRGAIYQELVPFALTYPRMGDSPIKGEELFSDQLLNAQPELPNANLLQRIAHSCCCVGSCDLSASDLLHLRRGPGCPEWQSHH